MLLISEDIIHRLGTMGRRGTLVNVFSFGWGKVVRMQDDDEWAPESGQHAEDEAVFACFKFWESRVYRGGSWSGIMAACIPCLIVGLRVSSG